MAQCVERPEQERLGRRCRSCGRSVVKAARAGRAVARRVPLRRRVPGGRPYPAHGPDRRASDRCWARRAAGSWPPSSGTQERRAVRVHERGFCAASHSGASWPARPGPGRLPNWSLARSQNPKPKTWLGQPSPSSKRSAFSRDAPVHVRSMARSASVITPVWLRSVHGMAGSASTTVYEVPPKSRVELPAPGG